MNFGVRAQVVVVRWVPGSGIAAGNGEVLSSAQGLILREVCECQGTTCAAPPAAWPEGTEPAASSASAWSCRIVWGFCLFWGVKHIKPLHLMVFELVNLVTEE